ncbi:hypothetical protein CPB83DRAFT_481073 [Crepidotus variabilis]|uniref:Uncharacterized protein n=1 Tax=Crepidotus variabilis TaxID=179855 RepID=A0A9P6ERE2_9AGAR|nr:hypothetical protein CPB83DRAFT_481073 [Crepidotus variabilis]
MRICMSRSRLWKSIAFCGRRWTTVNWTPAGFSGKEWPGASATLASGSASDLAQAQFYSSRKRRNYFKMKPGYFLLMGLYLKIRPDCSRIMLVGKKVVLVPRS